jgi:hypothetical protein
MSRPRGGLFMYGRMDGMIDPQSRRQNERPAGRALWPLAILGVLSFLALLYFAAYLAMGTRSITPTADAQIYNHEWQASVFEPAAKIESAIRRKQVEVWVKSDP